MKQKIKLSEETLHRIIRNCVNEALNELDARTYASYADKRDQQAQGNAPLSKAQQRLGTSQYGLQNKATDGRYKANDAWNKKYGRNDYDINRFGSSSTNRSMKNGEYNVQTNTNNIDSDGYGRNWTMRNYNPYNDTYNFDSAQYDYNGRLSKEVNANGEGAADEGERVARQMAQGNGKYVKGKGWQ